MQGSLLLSRPVPPVLLEEGDPLLLEFSGVLELEVKSPVLEQHECELGTALGEDLLVLGRDLGHRGGQDFNDLHVLFDGHIHVYRLDYLHDLRDVHIHFLDDLLVDYPLHYQWFLHLYVLDVLAFVRLLFFAVVKPVSFDCVARASEHVVSRGWAH